MHCLIVSITLFFLYASITRFVSITLLVYFCQSVCVHRNVCLFLSLCISQPLRLIVIITVYLSLSLCSSCHHGHTVCYYVCLSPSNCCMFVFITLFASSLFVSIILLVFVTLFVCLHYSVCLFHFACLSLSFCSSLSLSLSLRVSATLLVCLYYSVCLYHSVFTLFNHHTIYYYLSPISQCVLQIQIAFCAKYIILINFLVSTF